MSKCPPSAYRVCRAFRVLPLANPVGRPRATDWEIHTPSAIRALQKKVGPHKSYFKHIDFHYRNSGLKSQLPKAVEIVRFAMG